MFVREEARSDPSEVADVKEWIHHYTPACDDDNTTELPVYIGECTL